MVAAGSSGRYTAGDHGRTFLLLDFGDVPIKLLPIMPRTEAEETKERVCIYQTIDNGSAIQPLIFIMAVEEMLTL